MKVALYKGTRPGWAGLYNRAVRAWCLGPYSHCEVVVGENPDGSSVCWSSTWSDGGVRRKVMVLDPARWDLVEVAGDLAGVVAWFEAHAGQPYDLLGNFGFVFRPIADDKAKWFCSEAIWAAMGRPDSWRFEPNALAAALSPT